MTVIGISFVLIYSHHDLDIKGHGHILFLPFHTQCISTYSKAGHISPKIKTSSELNKITQE